MAIELTQEESKVLSQLAYMNNLDEFKKNGTLQQMATRLLHERDKAVKEERSPRDFGSWGSFTNKEQYDMLAKIAAGTYLHLTSLRIKDYENHEGGDNFVGYAFASDQNPKDVVCAFRGTMGSKVGDPSKFTGNAWINNYNLCVNNGSLQFDPAKAFVERNMEAGGSAFVTGHSQGGGNAMYVCASVPGVTGCVFDAPGIGQTLTPVQDEQLTKSNLINIVNQHDLVGAVMFHPEKRIYAQHFDYNELDVNGNRVHEKYLDYNNPDPNERGMKDTVKEKEVSGAFKGHYLQTMHFDGGNVIEGERSTESLAAEVASKTFYLDSKLKQSLGKPSLGDGVKILHSVEGDAADVRNINRKQEQHDRETREQYAGKAADEVAKVEQKTGRVVSIAYEAGAEALHKVGKLADKASNAAAKAAHDTGAAIVTGATNMGTAIKTSKVYKAGAEAVHDISQTIYNKFAPTASAAPDAAITEEEKAAAWNDRYKNVMEDIANSKTMAEGQKKINYYENDGELKQFRASGMKVDNDIQYITDNLKASDIISWDDRYKNVMNDIANSRTMAEAQLKINYYKDYNELDQFKASGRNADNDIQYITDNLKANDAKQQLADWNDRYKNVMEDIANSKTMAEGQKKINYYANDGELEQFRASGLKVDNDISYIADNLKKNDARVASEGEKTAAWNARYKNVMADIANSETMKQAQEKINYYQRDGELQQFRDSKLNVDNDIAYITNTLKAKDQAQSFCNEVSQNVNNYSSDYNILTRAVRSIGL